MEELIKEEKELEILKNIELIYNGENIDYVISAITYKNDGWVMPSLQFFDDYDLSDPKELECWDNDSYLIRFYDEFLVPFPEKPFDLEMLSDLIKLGFVLNDLPGIKKLLEEAFNDRILINNNNN